jgi:putative protease
MAKAKKAKKAASKLKRSKLKAKKPAPRKKVRKVAPKPARRTKATRKPAPIPVKPQSSRQTSPQPSAAPAAPPGDRVGVVTHYFSHLSVAVVKLDPGTNLHVGDNIHFKGHTSDFAQRVESLQIGHAPVDQVGPDDDFGLKVVDHVREHDVVYKVK